MSTTTVGIIGQSNIEGFSSFITLTPAYIEYKWNGFTTRVKQSVNMVNISIKRHSATEWLIKDKTNTEIIANAGNRLVFDNDILVDNYQLVMSD